VTRIVTLLGYVVLAAWAGWLQLTARRRGSGTFADAVRALVRHPLVRALVLAAWLWWGWHLFVRVDWRS